MDEIRAKLKGMENNKNNYSSTESSLTYPHWNIADGETATIRFLPDANQDNTFFWKERQLITLEFPGVIGSDNNKKAVVKVPCVEMYGDSCPILTELRPWWKNPELEDTARKYWKKRSFLLQGLVLESPLKEENVPENPIRKLIITPQIFNIIKAALLDPDMEYVPTDYDNGVNFVITKTTKGGFNDYSTSKYARRETSLTDEQRAMVDQHGLFDLSTWLPPKPDANALQAIQEMFEASVNGDMYDPERWAQYYKPYGFDIESTSRGSVSVPEAVKPAAAVADAQPAKAEPENAVDSVAVDKAVETASSSAADILAKIRSRTAS